MDSIREVISASQHVGQGVVSRAVGLHAAPSGCWTQGSAVNGDDSVEANRRVVAEQDLLVAVKRRMVEHGAPSEQLLPERRPIGWGREHHVAQLDPERPVGQVDVGLHLPAIAGPAKCQLVSG